MTMSLDSLVEALEPLKVLPDLVESARPCTELRVLEHRVHTLETCAREDRSLLQDVHSNVSELMALAKERERRELQATGQFRFIVPLAIGVAMGLAQFVLGRLWH